ncbi:PQQ-binding-like beta-propeller repeat protein [Streptomyces sp. NPDC127098]|uniref:outer membrane protein assembly factor BamB family protein n=1 Tax=Streptomyces sp. NPDC127098 TaxID=3347137 RepID=UPI00364CC48E
MPSPPSPPPGPRRGSPGGPGRRVALLAAVLGLLLTGSAGARWPLGGGTTGDDAAPRARVPDAEAARLAWAAPAPPVDPRAVRLWARGDWVAGDDLVRVADGGIASYDLATGARTWRLPLDLAGGVCQASPSSSGDRVAVLRGPDCGTLTVLDIAAGEPVAEVSLGVGAGDRGPGEHDAPAILGDTVAVGWDGGAAGFRLADTASGAVEVWRAAPDGGGPCVADAYAVVGGTLVSRTACGSPPGAEGGTIRATTERGEELWEWAFGPRFMGRPMAVTAVLSAEPLVVVARLGEDRESGAEHIFVIDDERQSIRHDLDYDRDRYLPPCRAASFADCGGTVVHEGHLYLTSDHDAPGSAGGNAVVAFDLATGLAEHRVPAVGGGDIRPFGVRDDRILAYQPAGEERAGLVVAIDPATGRAAPLLALDPAARRSEWALMSGLFVHEQRPLWHEGTLVLVNRVFYPGDAAAGRPALLVYR